MATYKHAIIRYQALGRRFRNTGRKYYVEDLINACDKAIYEFTGITEPVVKSNLQKCK